MVVYIIKDETELHERVFKLLDECDYGFGGYIDLYMGKFDARKKILGDVSDLIRASEKFEYHVVVAVSDNEKRKQLVNVLKKHENIKFVTLIHPSTPIQLHAKISKGCIVFKGGLVSYQSKVGKFTILGDSVVVGMDARVGKYCSIGWGAMVGNSSVVLKGSVLEPNAYVNSNTVFEWDFERLL